MYNININNMKNLILSIALLLSISLTAQTIQKDKQKHFVAGVVSGYVGSKLTKNKFLGALIGSLIVGVGKEVYDEIKYKGYDNKDILATALGGVTIGVTIKIFDK